MIQQADTISDHCLGLSHQNKSRDRILALLRGSLRGTPAIPVGAGSSMLALSQVKPHNVHVCGRMVLYLWHQLPGQLIVHVLITSLIFHSYIIALQRLYCTALRLYCLYSDRLHFPIY